MINTMKRIIFCTVMLSRLMAADVPENEQPWEKRQRERGEAKARVVATAETQAAAERRAIAAKEFEAQYHISYDVDLENATSVTEEASIPAEMRGICHSVIRDANGDHISPYTPWSFSSNIVDNRGIHSVIQGIKWHHAPKRLVALEIVLSDQHSLYVRVIDKSVMAITDSLTGLTQPVVVLQPNKNP